MFKDDEDNLNGKCSDKDGIPLTNCKHLMHKVTGNFLDTCIYSDDTVKLNLCGVEMYKDFLRLKFYCFCLLEDEKDVLGVYINDLKINGHLMTKLRSVAKLADGEFEDIYIDIPRTEAILAKEIEVIDLKFLEVLEEYDLQWSQDIRITCDLNLQMYAVNVGECKIIALEDGENILI